MIYFVTGASGFIGRRLVGKLLSRRGAVVHFLMRDASPERVRPLLEYWGVDADRAIAVQGDLTSAGLGIRAADRRKLEGRIRHVFHLAAIYDLKADAWEQLETAVLPFACGMNYNLEYDPHHRVMLLVTGGERGAPTEVWALRLDAND